MNAILHILRETYIKPFSEPKRCLTYLGMFLGNFGYNLILIAVPLSYSRDNPTGMILFYGMMFSAMGLLYFPLLYTGFGTRDGIVWRVFLFAFQLLCFVPLFHGGAGFYINGLICGLISTVYWGQFHIAMRNTTTDAKRGYQVVLADNIGIIALALSAWVSVHYADVTFRNLILICACLGMFTGGLCFTLVSPCFRDVTLRGYVTRTRAVLRQQIGLMLRILQRSLLATTDLILPALMYILHYQASTIGLFIILRTIIQTALSPVIATLIQGRRINEYMIGLAVCVLGWLILAVGLHIDATLLLFIVVNATGMRILNNANSVRLYAAGNYSALMLNEGFLAIGRITTIAAFIPLLFWNPLAFVLAMLAMAAAFVALETRLSPRPAS